jgi:hypothetical protein
VLWGFLPSLGSFRGDEEKREGEAWWREHPLGKIRRRGRVREHVREEDHNTMVELTRGA